MSGPSITQVSKGAFLVDGGLVNWVLLAEGESLLIIDAGYPGHWRAVRQSIEMIGHRPEQLVAALITHAHTDHIGSIPQLLSRRAFPVLMDPAEVPNAHGQRIESISGGTVLRHLWRPGYLGWGLGAARLGGLAHIRLPTAHAFELGHALDLPGRPIPIATHGHTSGHSCYLLPDLGAVVTGDALITGHPVTQQWGPQLLPPMFNVNHPGALSSLDFLCGLDADLILPGHGTLYGGSIDAAVAQARERATEELTK